jgi:hypothetical protein
MDGGVDLANPENGQPTHQDRLGQDTGETQGDPDAHLRIVENFLFKFSL